MHNPSVKEEKYQGKIEGVKKKKIKVAVFCFHRHRRKLRHVVFESENTVLCFTRNLIEEAVPEGAKREPGNFTKQFMDGSMKCGFLVTVLRNSRFVRHREIDGVGDEKKKEISGSYIQKGLHLHRNQDFNYKKITEVHL